MPALTPIEDQLQNQHIVMLDGGLATELERRGHDLNHPLWSARLLLSSPSEIQSVHQAYLDAGADGLITSSYQASFIGLQSQGLSFREAGAALLQTVTLAENARDRFLEQNIPNRMRPFIAASIGPYGAYLADGSEYRGDYGVSRQELRSFHQPRWELFAGSSADLLACETIPSFEEAQVLLELLEQTPDRKAWISFTSQDGHRISDGTPIRECAELLGESGQILAVGVNCTAPRHIEAAIINLRGALPTDKAIVAYPNSGEAYDPERKTWGGDLDPTDFALLARRWSDQGASLIGGCCRTGPAHIRAMRNALVDR